VLIDVWSTLRMGETLVPMILMSNRTHLSNFAGDKKEWPVYMTIRNLSSKICQTPSTHSIVIVALLPIPIKDPNIPQKRLDEQRHTNREVLNDVPRQLLRALTFKQHPSAGSGYSNVLFADGNFRRCKPVLAAWLADCPEYCELHHLERHVCFWCEYPKNELADYVHPDKQHPWRDHTLYRTLSDATPKGVDAELSSHPVHPGSNVFRNIPCIVSDLPKPDLLHTIQIGILHHLQKWIFHFMKMHQQLDKYNAIRLSVPAYHDLTPKNESYVDVSQWNWKEMKEMSRYQLGVVTQSLQGGIPAQHPTFDCATQCTLALLEFYMYAQYKSHYDATLSYMEDVLHYFHTFRDVFLLGPAGNKSKAKTNALRTELVKKRTVDTETNAETWTPSKKRCEINA
jgi:prepilin-type processing-associated H-X9-DG protein